MRVRFSTIIHARTKDVDFRSKLLVVPENFREEEIQWARRYIVDSTRYFELMNEDGRRVVFCNDKYMIHGISIRIGDLYRKCNREPKYSYVDGNRTNYAFIGLVMLKKDLTSAIEIPYSAFLEEYEKYMELRWNDPHHSSKSLENTKAVYLEREVFEAERAERIDEAVILSKEDKVVLPEDPASLNAVIAKVQRLMKEKKNLAFCSNMPNAASIIQSDFSIVTSLKADSIRASMQKTASGLDKEYGQAKRSGKEYGEEKEKGKEKGNGKEKGKEKGSGREKGKEKGSSKYQQDKASGIALLDILPVCGMALALALVLGSIFTGQKLWLTLTAGFCALFFGGIAVKRLGKKGK